MLIYLLSSARVTLSCSRNWPRSAYIRAVVEVISKLMFVQISTRQDASKVWAKASITHFVVYCFHAQLYSLPDTLSSTTPTNVRKNP